MTLSDNFSLKVQFWNFFRQMLRVGSNCHGSLFQSKCFWLLLYVKHGLVFLLQNVLQGGGSACVYLMRICSTFLFFFFEILREFP